jgi:hypothetical protein
MARCGSRRQVDGAIIAAKLNNVTNPSRASVFAIAPIGRGSIYVKMITQRKR